jgi:Domain of unknown function (DUF4124)
LIYHSFSYFIGVTYVYEPGQSLNQPSEIHYGNNRYYKDSNAVKLDRNFEIQKEVEKAKQIEKANANNKKLTNPKYFPNKSSTNNNTTTNQIQNTTNSTKYEALPSDTNNRVYKWKDKNGAIHVTNDPGTVPQEIRDQIEKEESEKLRN